jgi:adenylate kinase
MRILLLGMPGAGKGTQAQFLMQRYHIPQIATGDILRAAARAGTSIGLQAKLYMDRGALVPDELVTQLVKERIRQPDCANGFIMDGFPRTLSQAEALRDAGIDVDLVIDIHVSDDEILRRLSGRRVHPGSGRTYHVEFNPPRVAGRDDVTGEPLVQRRDDTEETIRQRIATYHRQTEPLLNYYKSWARSGDARAPRGISVDGTGPVEEIRDRMFSAIDSSALPPAR